MISASAIAKIFDGGNKEAKLKSIAMVLKKMNFRNELDHAKRGESRRWHKEGFGKKMSALKTKTGDKGLLVLRNKDKEEGRLTILATELTQWIFFFERIIFNSIFEYLEENSLLCPNQSGFRPFDSFENQLLSIVHDMLILIKIQLLK